MSKKIVLECSHGDFDALHASVDGAWTWRIGKKQAGRIIDGRSHGEFPRIVS